ncbi:MAG TPA: hypothetical protein VMU11_00435, partial [Verrucomicrobiae bacterium]|nr:hypothetical protein [Verrucomicrobiae bacterium]
MKKSAAIAFFVVALLVLAGIGWFVWSSWKAPVSGGDIQPTPVVSDLTVVSQLVTDFGNALKNVPLSGTRDVADQAMDQNYATYLSAPLLMQWKDDPSHALGRPTSSPWPQRIEIEKLVQTNATTYDVTGDIIEITSEDLAQGTQGSRVPVHVQVQNFDGHWLITSATTGGAVQPPADQLSLFEAPRLFTLAYPMNYVATTGTGLGGANLDRSWISISIPDGVMDTT